jgi:CBS domain containing-hemolysin-like protein/mannitol/fructose-specific phosphotransferase system IIA component (Ntr-type)
MAWLAASLLLIAVNATFVLMEYALVKVRSSRVEILARKGNAAALRVQEIQARLDDYLAAIQVGITIVALALGWIGEPTMASWVARALTIVGAKLPEHVLTAASFGLGLLLLAWVQGVFGELVPRAIGIQKAETIAMWGSRPLQLFALLFRLPVSFMSFCSISLLKLLGLKPAAQAESVVSEEEMRILIGETQERGSLPLERLMLLENLFDFGAAKVSEAMIPRDKIVHLSLKKSMDENLELVRSRRLSRYPLCEDGLDTVVGMVHVKDIVLKGDDGRVAGDLKRARRDMAEVLESDPLEKLLKYFPDKGIHLAIVRNGLGHVVGLITLEDIVEELIGEVHDEFDLPQAWSLMDVVVPQAVSVGQQAADRKTAIAQLVSRLCAAAPGLVKEPEVLQIVWEREMKFSSAVGRGVAVPHGRLTTLERPLVALARYSPAVPFPSPDNVPVRLVFLILTPAATPVIQLKVLGRIASLVTNENLRRKLLRAKTAESMLEILRTADTLLAA